MTLSGLENCSQEIALSLPVSHPAVSRTRGTTVIVRACPLHLAPHHSGSRLRLSELLWLMKQKTLIIV